MASSSVHNVSNVGVHRRRSQVFVEIPPSPQLNKARLQQVKVDNSSNQHKDTKENTVPLSTKAFTTNVPVDAKSSGKRKLQDADMEKNMNPKKVKVQKVDGNDLVACHQCRAKKNPNVVLRCTSNLKKTGKRCAASYCSACLKTRYGENLDTLSQREPPISREGHDPSTNYHFTCPRCSDFCNCGPCRRKKGLAPVGKIILSKEGESVREILEKNPQASGILHKSVATSAPKLSRFPDVGGSDDVTNSKKNKNDPMKPKIGRNIKPIDREQKKHIKTVPEPVWRPAPQTVTRREIEDRIYLREFILRFSCILDVTHRNVEELDDFSTLHDQSTKAVLIGLLGLIATEDDIHKKSIQAAIKNIRSLGLNWSKIVPILYDLRESAPADHSLRSLPSVEQLDVQATYKTRGANMQALYADQLLPVLLYLVDVVSGGESVREELEEGIKQGKDIRAVYSKAQREETERWTTTKAEFAAEKEELKEKKSPMDAFRAKYREAEVQHKAIVFDIQNSFKPELDLCSSRFTPLGCDMEGRTYYSLSASGPQRGKKERLPSEGERSRKWGWFISVWGKPGAVVEKEEDPDKNEGENLQAERWWFFTDVQEMRKLSAWLAYRAEVDICRKEEMTHASTSSSTVTPRPRNTAILANGCPSSSSEIPDSASGSEMVVDRIGAEAGHSQLATQAGVKALAKAVLEFADFVAWRTDDRRSAYV